MLSMYDGKLLDIIKLKFVWKLQKNVKLPQRKNFEFTFCLIFISNLYVVSLLFPPLNNTFVHISNIDTFDYLFLHLTQFSTHPHTFFFVFWRELLFLCFFLETKQVYYVSRNHCQHTNYDVSSYTCSVKISCTWIVTKILSVHVCLWNCLILSLLTIFLSLSIIRMHACFNRYVFSGIVWFLLFDWIR